ncbi:MAG: hypothetical protein WCW47_02675 [Candidatus Paceibacterota bacterium]|jgi:hypothetical protein
MYSNKLLKIILAILSLLVVVVFLICYFVYEDIRHKNENYHTLLYNLSFRNDKQNYLTYAQKTIGSLSLDINRMDDSIISKKGEVEFIENLESVARGSGLSIEINSLILNNNSNLASSSIDILKIKAKTKGSWSASYTFLTRLELLPFKLRVNKFGLVSIDKEVTSTEIRMAVSSGIWQSEFEIDVLKYK